MKKLVLMITFILSACTIEIPSEEYNNEFLNPIDGQEYTVIANGIANSYIFFADTQRVLINTSDPSANGIYQLIEPVSPTTNMSIFKLQGAANLRNNYLAIRIVPRGTVQTIAVTIQGSKEQAQNSLQIISGNSAPATLSSSALMIGETLGSWFKTSRSGIFEAANTETWTFALDHNPDDNIDGTYTRIAPTINGGAPVTHRLTLQTNISSSLSIFSYLENNDLKLLGLAIDLSSQKLQANFFIRDVADAGRLQAEINILTPILENNFTWEFGISSDIQTPNGALDPVDKIEWVRINPQDRTYSPQAREEWDIAANQEVITVYTAGVGTSRIEAYLMIRTDVLGVYQLSSENLNDTGIYHNKFFAFSKPSDFEARFALGDSMQEVINMSNNQQGIIFVPRAESREKLFALQTASTETRSLNINDNTGVLKGRTGFGAAVSEDVIWLIGGYTTPNSLFTTAPNYPTGETALPQVEQNIVTLENLGGTLNDVTANVHPDRLLANTAALANVQQGQLTVSLSVQNTETLYMFGSGATVNDRIFFNNRGGTRTWVSRTLNSGPIVNRFNGTLYSFSNQIYLAGGSTISGAITDSARPGTFLAEILRSANGSGWENLAVDSTKMWTARTLPQVFVVRDTIILIGGYTQAGATITPVNDVWHSKDGGRTWTEVTVNSTVEPPTSAAAGGGMVPGVVYGDIIFMMDPSTREIVYSTDLGVNWVSAGTLSGTTSLFGSNLLIHNNQIYVIGGQSATTGGTMNQNIIKTPIAFDIVPALP